MIKIGSGNWIVDNLNSALETWNGKLTEIWQLISTTPEEFKGGGVWNVIVNINGALQAIGYALLVLFFVMGVVKTCGSFTELKKPEMAFKCFVRFILAQAAVMYGMELMTALFRVAQGMISTIMDSSGLADLSATTLPDEMVAIIESVGLIESIPLWAITLLGSLFIWVLALVMILTVYSRFFKLYSASGSAAVYVMEYSMYKTIARKMRCSAAKVKKKYTRDRIFGIEYETKHGIKRAEFYHNGFRKSAPSKLDMDTTPDYRYSIRPKEVIARFMTGYCELCCKNELPVMIYQVKNLKSLSGNEPWEQFMLKKRRKTLIVCEDCYKTITNS